MTDVYFRPFGILEYRSISNLDRWAFETGTLRDFVPQFVGSKCPAVGRLTAI